MFCPKCGIENPDNSKFCRSCGTDLGNVQAVLMGKSPIMPYSVDPRKRGVSWEFAITKTFTGLAFLIVSLILAVTGKFGAENWWFWLLIPAFASLSSGFAQIFQLKRLEKLEAGFATQTPLITTSHTQINNALPPVQTDYTMPPKQSIYDTEELATQPSVTENTTRHLKINEES